MLPVRPPCRASNRRPRTLGAGVFLIFAHAGERRPGSYLLSHALGDGAFEPEPLLISIVAEPSPTSCGGVCHDGPVRSSSIKAARRTRYGSSIVEWPSSQSRSKST